MSKDRKISEIIPNLIVNAVTFICRADLAGPFVIMIFVWMLLMTGLMIDSNSKIREVEKRLERPTWLVPR